jgi:MFS family permease
MLHTESTRPVAVQYLRGLDPHLPRSVWLLQAGVLANTFGNGLVIPFVLIYLHDVRGIPVATAAWIAAASPLAALASGLLAGSLADRYGLRQTLIGAVGVMAVAYAGFPLITEAWHALLLNALAGIGSGGFGSAQSALIAALTPADRRHSAFAQQRVTANAGLGLGHMAGGLIATTADPSTYTTLFAVDVATFLVFIAVLLRLPSPPIGQAPAPSTSGYGAALSDVVFRRVLILNLVLVAAGIALIMVLFPVFAKDYAHVDERGIGLAFFVNTLVIIVAQLPIARWEEGRRRMYSVALLAALWAGSCGLVLVGSVVSGGQAAAFVLCIALAVFGIGECLYSTVLQGPLAADLAPPHARGRYMGLNNMSWQVGFIVGPALGGLVLATEPLALWLVCALACLAAGAYALSLERGIPEDLLRTPIPKGATG